MDNPRVSVDHYENFPVASWLCPAELRPAVRAIYAYARTADDLADEGDAPPATRIQALDAYRADWHAVLAGHSHSGRWRGVFEPLKQTVDAHDLPLAAFDDLLSAFRQDCGQPIHADRAALLDYCARSANPIGRLMLALYRVRDPVAQARSDDVCTALQLINFWQDVGLDASRGRVYVPQEDARRHGFDAGDLVARKSQFTASVTGPVEVRRAVAELCDWARDLMLRGADVVHAVPGRAGWELRAVVQGGLRILDHLQAIEHDSFVKRPTLTARDAPVVLWRCLWMRRAEPHAAIGLNEAQRAKSHEAGSLPR
jgi:squalene synthase HpnC